MKKYQFWQEIRFFDLFAWCDADTAILNYVL